MNDAESGADGVPSNNIQQHGTGVHVGSISSDFTQGTLEVTGLDLDLAIQGEAFQMGVVFLNLLILSLENFFIQEPELLSLLLKVLW